MAGALERFLAEHSELSRRYFLKMGAGGAAWLASVGLSADRLHADEATRDTQLQSAIDKLETWLTSPSEFRDVSRGKPIPHSLPEEKKQEVGLTRESWKLEVISDPDHPVRLRKPMTKSDGTAFDFEALMELARTHAVRFPKVMSCLNIGCPLGMGIWEGVPLREVLWLTQPRDNLRRVHYFGYHNDDEKQMFRSSLPVGRILEDPFDLPPVILCYKLNGQWLSAERGGPVRVVVPEAYGFKSIKWLTTVVLSNLFHANDTYANGNNDVDSPLKTFAATLSVPSRIAPSKPIPITGYAQVGIGGLSKVQVSIEERDAERPAGDRYFAAANWIDAEILPPPANWGGELPDNIIPVPTINFDPQTGQPTQWPLRLGKAHWACLLPGLPVGEYVVRSRTVDDKGHAQPWPRPFRKSGHATIEEVSLKVATAE